MHSIESRFVIGQSNILFAGVYVCAFQPGNFTDWGSDGVNTLIIIVISNVVCIPQGMYENWFVSLSAPSFSSGSKGA